MSFDDLIDLLGDFPYCNSPPAHHNSLPPLIAIILLSKFLLTEVQICFYLTVRIQGLAWGIRWEDSFSPNASKSCNLFLLSPMPTVRGAIGKCRKLKIELSQGLWLQLQDPV